MDRSELMLQIKNTSFDDTVCQTDVLTARDIAELSCKGFMPAYTLDQFKEEFPTIDPSCIFYGPVLATSCFYYNKKTMASCLFPVERLILFNDAHGKDALLQIISEVEAEATKGKFERSAMCHQDRMRMLYIQDLIRSKGEFVKDVYSLFFSNYACSDYGFNSIDPEVIQFVMAHKPEEEKQQTAANLSFLPEEIDIYRGGNSQSTPYNKAYSWTLDINVANFFAARMGQNSGYIAKATVRKEDILEAFLDNDREQEIIVSPDKVKIKEVIELPGISFLEEVFPYVMYDYHHYVRELGFLDFAQKSTVHGELHEKRVLMLCLILAYMMDLDDDAIAVLATTAIYHDTMRVNDRRDPHHGEVSMEYYEQNADYVNPIVSMLCKYHCLDDDLIQDEITARNLDADREYITFLYNIFKDADALDRVRFGIMDLDLNQLRTEEAKTLTLVAQLNYSGIK